MSRAKAISALRAWSVTAQVNGSLVIIPVYVEWMCSPVRGAIRISSRHVSPWSHADVMLASLTQVAVAVILLR